MHQNNKNHCSNCGFDIKISDYKTIFVYKCLECGDRIPTATKICKKCGNKGYRKLKRSGYSIARPCGKCGYKEKKEDLKERVKVLGMDDPLFRKIRFDRQIMQFASEIENDALLVRKFIASLNSTKAVESLKEYMFPEDILENISKITKCDKAVEKSFLENIILWFLSTFMAGSHEQLAINAVAHNSERTVSRTLTDDTVISANALGVRLENENLVNALEMFLQFDAFRYQSAVFNENNTLKPVYYDWMYITKAGDSWSVCKTISSSEGIYGYKIGFAVDWNNRSIIGLNLHGAEHPNDALAFRRDLCIRNIKGIVHISDRGPFDTKHQAEIHQRGEYYIIRLRDNIKFDIIHSGNRNEYHELSIASHPKIKLLETGMVILQANPEMGSQRYIKFQYNSSRTGKFETIELVSNLPLDAIDIIELSAQRWRATETEFNILQHGFGLEKLFVKNPEKVWPLLLLVIICKTLFERILIAIHAAHGGTLNVTAFKRNLGILIEFVARGSGNKLPLSPCNSITCPYRRQRGTRLI